MKEYKGIYNGKMRWVDEVMFGQNLDWGYAIYGQRIFQAEKMASCKDWRQECGEGKLMLE